MTPFRSGSLIANRYVVVKGPHEKRELVGGMGMVFLCGDLADQGEPVALKTFKPKYLPDRDARDRFLREGNTWVELGRHPHIVRAFRVERIGDGREVYLVLEWVAEAEHKRDASLRSWLTPGKPLPAEQALYFALHIARGMRYATLKIPGFVHRDLKPENVLVGHDGNARVTDFGLAKSRMALDDKGLVIGATDTSPVLAHLTQDGVVGTPFYMAPEQWIPRHELEVSTDIYAFGCILYEMVAGKTAVTGKDRMELKCAHQEGRVGAVPSELTADLRELIQRCLAVSPARRYGNWGELEMAVAKAYRGVAEKDAPVEVAGKSETRGEQVAAGWSYNVIGASYSDIGKYDVAAQYFERALRVGRATNDNALQGGALNNLGNAYRDLGDARKAIELHEQSLAEAIKTGFRSAEAAALGNLGLDYTTLGDPRRAIEFHKQALVTVRELGDRRGEGGCLCDLGVAYQRLGDMRQAVELYEQGHAIGKEVQDRELEGKSLGNLGAASSARGDDRRAISFLEQSLRIARESGDRKAEGANLGNLGYSYRNLGDAKQALVLFEQRLVIAREIGDRVGEATVLGNIGAIHRDARDLDQAIECFEEYFTLAKEIGDRTGEGRALGNLGRAYHDMEDFEKAVEFYNKSLVIGRETGDSIGNAFTSFNVALLLVTNGQIKEAVRYAEEAAQVFEQIGQATHAAKARELSNALKGTYGG